jgi:hypothetical protein
VKVNARFNAALASMPQNSPLLPPSEGKPPRLIIAIWREQSAL